MALFGFTLVGRFVFFFFGGRCVMGGVLRIPKVLNRPFRRVNFYHGF